MTNEPTTGELIEQLHTFDNVDAVTITIAKAALLFIADLIESQEQTISALTARAEQAEANMPWVRLDGYDYFVQVKLFHHSDNNLTVYDKKYGWHTVEYSQVKEWRGLPQEGDGEE